MVFSHRHQGMGQLSLGQIVKRIGLILGRCHGIRHRIAAVLQFLYSGIMTGGDIVRADLHAAAKQCLPLYIAVAGDAGIGRPAVQVLLREIVHDLLPEDIPEIHDIIGNIQYSRHPARILHRALSAAASLFFDGTGIIGLPDLHRGADDIITLFLQ